MRKKPKRKSTRDHDFRSLEEKIQDVNLVEGKLKVVLYGKAGTGKTTLASTFPKPLLIVDVVEKGTASVSDVKDVKVLPAETWEDLDLLYWFLKKGKHNFKTVVIDTMSQAQDLAIKAIIEERGKNIESGDIGNWGTMTKQMWGSVSSKLKGFVRDLKELDMNVVFVAHDRIFNIDDEEDEEGTITPEVGPRLMPSVASVLNAAVGVIGNTFIRERVKKIKIGKKTRERRKVEYCLRIGPHAYYTTKVRKPKKVTPPAFIVDPDYESIMDLMKG